MNGLICYFSTTGNTLLACSYIAQEIRSTDFELLDIAKGSMPDFNSYQVVGFATFTASLGPPVLVQDFIKSLPQQDQKPAFIFNTYANFSGLTLKVMGDLLTEKGFKIIASHSMHTPENYPPYIVNGITRANAPGHRELKRFKSFIDRCRRLLADLSDGKAIPKAKIRIGWFNRILPVLRRKSSQNKMGMKFVDPELCTECGICRESCPYRAIRLEPKPVFDNEKCRGCWSCYNHCPVKAIYTEKLKGIGHYPKPNELFRNKLKIS
jgi:ferredoxin/flavodoxin